ncbi:glycosyl transferase family protein [endosymbiont of Acanthamoeba sp. UWC8]|uniref:ArnT family glycosyltransferase n=1 Tax=endosymbiont of Acanthamoeba sp. UWC8 TaxID=86106 RepID=UPI0004D129F5|nr:glycosyltransferase family 39 protein [endosymbiont of Acanthamoeba sp. UWC8]AIF81207.1 glycosyl transferase family protein [endosymbiont of Acanthamoeba sp. UWC8]
MKTSTNKLLYFIAFILLSVGSIRIILTYDKLTISPDELVHVATGLELIENGTYYLEALHPPLARLSVAILPYLGGASLSEEFYAKYSHPFNENSGYKQSFEGRNLGGQQIFFAKSHDNYKKMVFLSRLGILPYFLLCGIVIFVWVRTHIGSYTALYSILFYTTLPIILANSGLATTDMPMCALLTCTIFALLEWLESASFKNTLLLGFSFALLVVTKFSGAIFFLIVAAPIILAKDYATGKVSRGFNGARVTSIMLISIITFFMVWCTYNFELTTLSYPYFLTPEKVSALKASLRDFGLSEKSVKKLFTAKILPFPEFFHGLSDLSDRIAYVYAGYIFGKVLLFQGVWYFFPAATLFKTPLFVLALGLLGCCLLIKIFISQKNWKVVAPVIVVFTLLLASTAFNMNIGLRHLLPIFPFICITAGYSLDFLLNRRPLFINGLTVLLLAAYLVTTALSHPFYVAYFNFMAQGRGEEILIDSDFDIGQELEYALTFPEVHNNIDSLKLYYSGLADPGFFGFKEYVLYQMELHHKNFNINFGNSRYLLISIPLLKLLPKEKKSDIAKCKDARRIGQTFMLYDFNSCI